MMAFACGGTGGHVYPAIALAQNFSKKDVYFISAYNKKEINVIANYGYDLINLKQFKIKICFYIFNFFLAFLQLFKNRPKILISTGGYSSFPAIMSAAFLRIPIFILEQNVLPGRVNRYAGFFAKKVFISFTESKKYFSEKKVIVAGNPVRKFFLEDKMFQSFSKEIISVHKTILVFGGSQGARALNKFIQKHYMNFLDMGFNIIHLTGKEFYKENFGENLFEVVKNIEDDNKIFILPYFEKMDYLLKIIDIAVCRAGATTIAELLSFNKPAVLIPYPYAKDNHQLYNAKAMVETGKAKLILEKDLEMDLLMKNVNELLARKQEMYIIADPAQIIIKELSGYLG